MDRDGEGVADVRKFTCIASACLALALVLTALPAMVGQMEVLALPQTVSDRVDIELPAAAGEATGSATVTDAVRTPITFSMVGFELPDGVDELRVRTSVDGEEWTRWTATARMEDEDRPDPATAEGADDRSQRFSDVVWVEEANYLQLELPAGAAGHVRAELIDSMGHSGGPVERRIVTKPTSAADAHAHPSVISRAEWGANEDWAGTPSYADDGVHMGVVHHTATSNDYTDAKAVMRSMYHYHTQSLGWKDLGYNIVVDQEGNVYEGRKGGLDKAVIGAHARGYNTGSFGISVIGNFDQKRPPTAAVDAVSQVIGWKSAIHDIDPEGWTNETNGSWTRTILGHRDVGTTACPGAYFYPLLDDIRAAAADVKANAPEPESSEPPVTSITSGPASTVLRDHVTVEFSATGDVYWYECRFNSPDWYPCASPQTFTELENGDYEFSVRAVDSDSVREDPPADRAWTIDVAPSFSDIADSVHASAIEAVADASIANGYDDGTFRPLADVRRGQMASFLQRALDLPDGSSEQFSDVEGSAHEAAIGAVAAAEISEGYPDGTFRPNDPVTRGQMATFLFQSPGVID